MQNSSRYSPITNERCEKLALRALVWLGWDVKYYICNSNEYRYTRKYPVCIYKNERILFTQYKSFRNLLDQILLGHLPAASSHMPNDSSHSFPNKEALEIELDAKGVSLDGCNWELDGCWNDIIERYCFKTEQNNR